MVKTKKRRYRKRARTLTGKRKNKSRYILYAVTGFILLISLSIYTLNYINKSLKRDVSSERITEEELSDAILVADKKLNEIISASGFVNKEIANKTVSTKSYHDLKWQFKDVDISTRNSDKIEEFKKKLSAIRLDNLDYYIDNIKGNSVFLINLYGLATHKLTFRYVPENNNTDKKVILNIEIKDTASKVASIKPDADKRNVILKSGMRPKVAIIVDDIGLNKQFIDDLLNIPTRLNFAVLPNLPYSEYAAEKASNKGWDVLLHLPMEPKLSSGYTGLDAGEGVLLTGLPKNYILELLDKNLQSVPYIKGVNNHMGSKFTENTELMSIVLKEIKKNELFYIDSKTTPKTVGFTLAKKIGVKTAQRDVFLDENKASKNFIKKRLEELVNISKKNGVAVGICHPYPNTIKVLSESLPPLETIAEFASASNIVR